MPRAYVCSWAARRQVQVRCVCWRVGATAASLLPLLLFRPAVYHSGLGSPEAMAAALAKAREAYIAMRASKSSTTQVSNQRVQA